MSETERKTEVKGKGNDNEYSSILLLCSIAIITIIMMISMLAGSFLLTYFSIYLFSLDEVPICF